MTTSQRYKYILSWFSENVPIAETSIAQNNDQIVSNPGLNLGILSLVMSFLIAPVGTIVGIIALVKSKKAGYKNYFAIAGIVISVCIEIAALSLFIWFIVAMFNSDWWSCGTNGCH